MKRKGLLLSLVLALASTGFGQTWYSIAHEGAGQSDSPTLSLPAGTYQFGTQYCRATGAAAFATFTLTAPKQLSMYWDPWPWPVSDPCPNTSKEIDIQETSATQTVTVNGVDQTVPALAPQPCPIPTAGDPHPSIPATPANCALAATAKQIAVDGDYLTVTKIAAPIALQYCWGSVCNAPFIMMFDLWPVGPNVYVGGPPTSGPAQQGTLYVIPTQSFDYILGGTPQKMTVSNQ